MLLIIMWTLSFTAKPISILYLLCLLAGCTRVEKIVENDGNISLPYLPFHQSMAFSNGKALFLVPDDFHLNCLFYDIDTKTLDAQIRLPIIGEFVPHANAACFSNELYSKDSFFPALYVSAWNGNRCAYVYDFKFSDGLFEPFLIQLIDPSNVSECIIGAGHLNWVVDKKENHLISIAYKLHDGDMVEEGNCINITWFDLPPLLEEVIQLNDQDVRAHVAIPIINAFQDMFISDNYLYIAAGIVSGRKSANSVFFVNLSDLSVTEKKIPLIGEPEGLCEYGGEKYISAPDGSGIIYNLGFLF